MLQTLRCLLHSVDADFFPFNSLQFAAGEYSFRACDGHCENTFRPSMAKELFLGTERLETYIHPGSGRALNFHTNATGLYGVIANFLEQNGF